MGLTGSNNQNFKAHISYGGKVYVVRSSVTCKLQLIMAAPMLLQKFATNFV
jgi:hypothetical protein